jgi:hypothetical protein
MHACAGCGEQRRPVTLDRQGRHRCQNCPDDQGDPLQELTQLVTALDPGLSRETIEATLQQATTRPAGQRRAAWAIVGRPDLLTGAGACAPSPAVLRFIDGLAAAGATQIVRPACPRCNGVKALSKLLDSLIMFRRALGFRGITCRPASAWTVVCRSLPTRATVA